VSLALKILDFKEKPKFVQSRAFLGKTSKNQLFLLDNSVSGLNSEKLLACPGFDLGKDGECRGFEWSPVKLSQADELV